MYKRTEYKTIRSREVDEGLDKFRRLFDPTVLFIVSDGDIGAEEFLSMDLTKLF